MTQNEAVIQVMQENGGYATLGYLNLHVPSDDWKTLTPFATIRRIVQDTRYFFKIRPGLWALKGWEKKIPAEILAQATQARGKSAIASEFDHSYYQGLLVEIGNLKKCITFVPNQDKNRKFIDKPLASVTTLGNIYPFTYPELVQRAQTIDVIWFNDRKMPNTFFEVEHKTDIKNSLLKFVELQDFNVQFRIVASQVREREFVSKIGFTAFKPIAQRVKFVSYENVSDMHARQHEMARLENGF